MAKFNYQVLSREDGFETSSSVENGTSHVSVLLYGDDQQTAPTEEQLNDFCAYVCGSVGNLDPVVSTTASTDGGKIKRSLPLLHPYDPSLSVTGVTKYMGYDQEDEETPGVAIELPGVTPFMPEFSKFINWKYTVEFGRRPYFMIPDSIVSQAFSTYYKPDGTPTAIVAATEWQRFTKRKLIPAPDTVNATTGAQMRFRTNGTPLNGTQYPSQVLLFMQNSILELEWFMVPYRYFFTDPGNTYQPYMTRFVNTVNQNPFLGFPAGALMWLGATPEPFMPQQPNAEQYITQSLSASQSLLCNVKMRWMATARTSTDAPSLGADGLSNRNNIAAGHNLQPSFTDRQFHYVTTEDPNNRDDQSKWFASYQSFPHELFFTDPMLVQPGGPL